MYHRECRRSLSYLLETGGRDHLGRHLLGPAVARRRAEESRTPRGGEPEPIKWHLKTWLFLPLDSYVSLYQPQDDSIADEHNSPCFRVSLSLEVLLLLGPPLVSSSSSQLLLLQGRGFPYVCICTSHFMDTSHAAAETPLGGYAHFLGMRENPHALLYVNGTESESHKLFFHHRTASPHKSPPKFDFLLSFVSVDRRRSPPGGSFDTDCDCV